LLREASVITEPARLNAPARLAAGAFVCLRDSNRKEVNRGGGAKEEPVHLWDSGAIAMGRYGWILGLLVVLGVTGQGCGRKTAGPTAASANEVSQFYSAVSDGDAEIVRRLLQAKPYLANAKNESGQTPLAFAKQKGNEEVADVISKAGGHE
jgi:hypothetical protein